MSHFFILLLAPCENYPSMEINGLIFHGRRNICDQLGDKLYIFCMSLPFPDCLLISAPSGTAIDQISSGVFNNFINAEVPSSFRHAIRAHGIAKLEARTGKMLDSLIRATLSERLPTTFLCAAGISPCVLHQVKFW